MKITKTVTKMNEYSGQTTTIIEADHAHEMLRAEQELKTGLIKPDKNVETNEPLIREKFLGRATIFAPSVIPIGMKIDVAVHAVVTDGLVKHGASVCVFRDGKTMLLGRLGSLVLPADGSDITEIPAGLECIVGLRGARPYDPRSGDVIDVFELERIPDAGDAVTDK